MATPSKVEVALSKQLQAANDEVAAIIGAMAEASIGSVGQNMVAKALEPLFQGIVLAHATDASPEEVEDAINNVFLLSLAYYFRRRYKNREEAIKGAQEAINNIANEIGNNIDKDFPTRIILPESGKLDG